MLKRPNLLQWCVRSERYPDCRLLWPRLFQARQRLLTNLCQRQLRIRLQLWIHTLRQNQNLREHYE